MTQDIRWKKRFYNYSNALAELSEGAQLAALRPLSKLEKQGIIQGFEYTHELAWNLLKDYLEYQGIVGLIGSRDSTREAFKRGLISDGETWMEMIKSRNLTSHAYDRETAEQIVMAIQSIYVGEFEKLHAEFTTRCSQEN